MLNFEEELKKFQPVVQTENVEDLLRQQDLNEILALLEEEESEDAQRPAKE